MKTIYSTVKTLWKSVTDIKAIKAWFIKKKVLLAQFWRKNTDSKLDYMKAFFLVLIMDFAIANLSCHSNLQRYWPMEKNTDQIILVQKASIYTWFSRNQRLYPKYFTESIIRVNIQSPLRSTKSTRWPCKQTTIKKSEILNCTPAYEKILESIQSTRTFH